MLPRSSRHRSFTVIYIYIDAHKSWPQQKPQAEPGSDCTKPFVSPFPSCTCLQIGSWARVLPACCNMGIDNGTPVGRTGGCQVALGMLLSCGRKPCPASQPASRTHSTQTGQCVDFAHTDGAAGVSADNAEIDAKVAPLANGTAWGYAA